jgi:hypothetical protein
MELITVSFPALYQHHQTAFLQRLRRYFSGTGHPSDGSLPPLTAEMVLDEAHCPRVFRAKRFLIMTCGHELLPNASGVTDDRVAVSILSKLKCSFLLGP